MIFISLPVINPFYFSFFPFRKEKRRPREEFCSSGAPGSWGLIILHCRGLSWALQDVYSVTGLCPAPSSPAVITKT